MHYDATATWSSTSTCALFGGVSVTETEKERDEDLGDDASREMASRDFCDGHLAHHHKAFSCFPSLA